MMDQASWQPHESGRSNFVNVGGNVDECTVTVCFHGEELEPDEVTHILGVKPTNSCRKGDRFRGKKKDRIEKQGRWLFELDWSNARLDDQINRILDELTSDLTGWITLSRRFQTRLSCGLWMMLWNRGLDLSPRTMQRIAERGLTLDIDIYYVGDEPARDGS
jgi:hypothetical protein